MNRISCRSSSTTTIDNSAIVSRDSDNLISQANKDCDQALKGVHGCICMVIPRHARPRY